MLPTNRHDALASGSRFYNTGRPCRSGHSANRYTSTGNCCECLSSGRRQTATLFQRQFGRGRIFNYLLHPDDHAAALAYCQALDMQRGRTPALTAVTPTAPAPSGDFQLPDMIAERRAQIITANAPAPAPRHVPDEMASYHPTNGS